MDSTEKRRPSRGITVSAFRELLNGLPDEWVLEPNSVGNIAIESGEDGDYVGYIDFQSKTVEVLDESGE